MSETDCERVLRFLETYCDREVSAGDAALVERHLSGCSPCLDRREFRVRLKAIIRTRCGGAPELPPDVTERVRASLGL